MKEHRIDLEVPASANSAPLFLALQTYRAQDNGGLGVASTVFSCPACEAVYEKHRFETTLFEVLGGLSLHLDETAASAQLSWGQLRWVPTCVADALELRRGDQAGQQRRTTCQNIKKCVRIRFVEI